MQDFEMARTPRLYHSHDGQVDHICKSIPPVIKARFVSPSLIIAVIEGIMGSTLLISSNLAITAMITLVIMPELRKNQADHACDQLG